MKKLLIVSDTYHPKTDGIIRFLDETIPHLKKEFEIKLLVPELDPKKEKDIIKITTSKVIKLSGYHSIKISPRNIKKIKKTVKEHDIIFVQGPALLSFLAIHYGKKFNKKIVYYTHIILWELYEKFLPWPINKITSKIIKKIIITLLNKCDLILCPYKSLVQELKKENITQKTKIVKLGVNTKKFYPPEYKYQAKKELNLSPKKIILGYVGRISKEKNIEVLAKAFERLSNKYNLFLLIVGSGEEKIIEKIGRFNNAQVTGFKKDVSSYLKAMDIFIMPSLTETTSLATLEAMASGLPVITTKVGFLEEYVIKDYNGLFFPKGNLPTLLIQLKKLIKNPEKRKKLGENGRKVAESFSWEKTTQALEKTLKEI